MFGMKGVVAVFAKLPGWAQVAAVLALLALFVWVGLSVKAEREERSDQAHQEFMTTCVPNHGRRRCEEFLQANDEDCFRPTHRQGRHNTGTNDPGGYAHCLEHGIESYRARRDAQRASQY